MLWVLDTPLSSKSDRNNKIKYVFDITLFWEFHNKAILSCHDNITTLFFPTKVSTTFTYTIIIICKTICKALMLVAVNLLNIVAVDITNAYFTAPYKENIEPLSDLNLVKSKSRKPSLLEH